MPNHIFTKESLKELESANIEIEKAKEFIKNSRALIIAGAYGATLSVSLQLIITPLTNPKSINDSGLFILGFFLFIISTMIAFGYYQRIYRYGPRHRSYNLIVEGNYEKGKSALIKKLKDEFGTDIHIYSTNDTESGNKEDVIFIHDPQKERNVARFTYVKKTKLILIRLDLENRHTGTLIRALKNIGAAGI